MVPASPWGSWGPEYPQPPPPPAFASPVEAEIALTGAEPAIFSEEGEVILLFTGYKLDTKLEFGEHKDYTKDYPGLPKDYPSLSKDYPSLSKVYPSLSKDYPSLSKDYPSLSKEYPGLSKDYASLPKEYLSKDYAKDYMAGGLMKASEYHKLGAGPLHHGDYKPYSDLSLSKPSLGDYKPGWAVSPSLKNQKSRCS